MPDRPRAAVATQTHRSLAEAHDRLARTDASVVESQIAIAQIAAPTGDEGERAAWVARRFETLGLEGIDIDAAGNAVGRRPGASRIPPVSICAHLDTVFPRGTDLSVRQHGSRLTGPGINDNGRGLAVMLAIAGAIDGRQVGTSRPIEFVATTGEEGLGDLRGAKHYFASRGADAHCAIVIDGAGDERIVHRALGSRRFRISFDGPGGHSWAAFGTPNAVHAAAAAATTIAALPLPVEPRTTLTVSRIGGGLSVNSIPAHAWIEVDLRSSSATTLHSMEKRIAAAAHDAGAVENRRSVAPSSDLRVRVEIIGDRPGGEIGEDHALVQTAIHATQLAGRVPELAMASTDANVPISLGIPAIAIGGGGRGGDAHSAAEWYDNVGGTTGIARALTIVAAAAAD